MKKENTFPEQKQDLPGDEYLMKPEPEIIKEIMWAAENF
jgi:hypothetical protein